MSRKVIFGLLLIPLLSLMVPSTGIFAAEDVRITGHRLIVDQGGITHIAGIVENSGESPVTSVQITAQLFDKDGKELPTYRTKTLIQTVMPGYVVPFDVIVSDRSTSDRLAYYILSAEWKPGMPKSQNLEFADTKTFIWSHIDPHTKQYRNPHGDFCTGKCYFKHSHGVNAHSETDGLVVNTGEDDTRRVKVAVIWYDERGQFYSYDLQNLKDLSAGEAGRFVIMTHPAMGYHSLVAESNDYVGILTEDDEKMFRVYDANRDNPRLPGVATIGMTDVVVSNGQSETAIPLMTRPAIPHYVPPSAEAVRTLTDGGTEYSVQVKTYADKLLDLRYEESGETIRFFLDRAGGMAHAPIHVEITVPAEFEKFASAQQFQATFEGVSLDQKLFFVDPYSYPGMTAFHYIISKQDLAELWTGIPPAYLVSDSFEFTLRPLHASSTIPDARNGEALEFSSTLTNSINKKQHMVFVIEIQTPSGENTRSWIQGTIPANDSVEASFSWIPEMEGTYSVRMFLWESLDYHGAMSGNFAEAKLVVTD
ncbi:MAG: FxLYD domain-containing protein [Nitrososphaerales archaeon]